MAENDVTNLPEDFSVRLDVLANDSNVDTVTNLRVVSPPTNGTAIFDDFDTPGNPNDDRILYTPAADFFGSDSFRYEVETPCGISQADVQVTITARNDPPTLSIPTTIEVDEDFGPFILVGFASGDPGGGPDEDTQTVSFEIKNNSNPDLFVIGPTIDASSGTLEFTSVENAHGSAIIRVAAIDDGNVPLQSPQSSFTIVVKPVNDTPETVADTATVSEDDSVLIDVLANDTDLDLDDNPSNFTVLSVSTPSVTGLTGPGTGTGSVVGNQVLFETGNDFDELDIGDEATVTLQYTMSDSKGATSSNIITTTVFGTNDRPTAVADSATVLENKSVVIDVLANDTDLDLDDNPNNFTVLSVTPMSVGSDRTGYGHVLHHR